MKNHKLKIGQSMVFFLSSRLRELGTLRYSAMVSGSYTERNCDNKLFKKAGFDVVCAS